jgi:hypothetical protein
MRSPNPLRPQVASTHEKGLDPRSEQVAVSRSMLYRGWTYWALLVLVCGAPAVAATRQIGSLNRVSTLVAVEAFALLFWYSVPWIYVLSASRGVRDLNGPYTTTLGDNAVVVEARHGRVEWSWDAFVRVVETDQHILLYLGKHQAQFLPKRAVSSSDVAAVRHLLVAKLGTRARLRTT